MSKAVVAGQQLVSAVGAVRAIGNVSGKTVRLISSEGTVIDSFDLPRGKELPEIFIFGIDTRERVFRRDKNGEYREVSFLHAPMEYRRAL